jgi:O-antigen/teichoic acid export membrane protein
VFGEGFREALGVLAIVTIAEMVLSIYFMYQSLLVGFSRPRGIGPPQVLGGVVAVLLNLVMIPVWGMRGAAYACLLGHAALAVISGIWTNRELRRLDT